MIRLAIHRNPFSTEGQVSTPTPYPLSLSLSISLSLFLSISLSLFLSVSLSLSLSLSLPCSLSLSSLLSRFVIAHALSHALSHALFCSFSSPLRLQRHSMIKEPRPILLPPPPPHTHTSDWSVESVNAGRTSLACGVFTGTTSPPVRPPEQDFWAGHFGYSPRLSCSSVLYYRSSIVGLYRTTEGLYGT